MSTLQTIRKAIDEVDEQIVHLLNKRAKLTQDVGHAKGPGIKLRPAREAEVLAHVKAVSTGPFRQDSLVTIYREIISCALALEQPLRVAYLGPPGTYSEEAARKRFGVAAVLVPCATVDEVVGAVGGPADVALVPVENSTEGAVNRTLDLLLQTPAQVIGETLLPIHHQLLGPSAALADVRTVVAHPQSLAQCRQWLRHHLPHAKQVAVESNAQAAIQAAEHGDWAAIASAAAGARYKLPVMAANIEDDSANTTRFLVLGTVPVPATGHDKTSLICSIPNVPGALSRIISVLADAGLNLTNLESRPAASGLWDYVFYLDIDGHQTDLPVQRALEMLKPQALSVRVAGSYPKETI
jgi:chorismate mutase / prephenate dehydratase